MQFTEAQIKSILDRNQRIVVCNTEIVTKDSMQIETKKNKLTYCVFHKFFENHAIVEEISTGLVVKRYFKSMRFLSDEEITNLYSSQQKLNL